MKIGIDATICFTAQPTGLGIYTINIINALSRLHDDIVVWTVNDTGMMINREKIRKVMQPLRFTGKKLFQVRPFWIDRFLPKMLLKEGVDMLFTTVPSALTRSPVPHVVTVLDVIPLTFPGESPMPVCWNYRYRVPKILKNASLLITISDYSKRDVERYFNIDPQKMHTVYLGYDTKTFAPKKDSQILARYGLTSKGYILSVGNASPRKNLNNLINAYSRIQEKVPHKLVLCGSKTRKEARQLQELISQYGLSRRVILIDYVPYADLPVLYTGAVLFVYVSLYEGFGLPILEAMACGTPVLASAATSIPEVAGDAALLVDPVDVEAIGHAIMEIISNKNLIRDLSSKGLKRCNKFTWEDAARKILAILKTC